MPEPTRSWQVLLIGGAAGVGKSSISYRIAQHFGVGITEIDDFMEVMKVMTTPEQQPVLHYWDTHPEAAQLPPKEIVKLTVAVSEIMQPAVEAVIVNHLLSFAPVVLDGDYLLPALAAQTNFGDIPNAGQVRAIFLHEPDEEQITRNFRVREPQNGDQSFRAHISWLYGEWLKLAAEHAGVPVLNARPWGNLFERVLAAIE
jgi:2-phosphoglycerate kinase